MYTNTGPLTSGCAGQIRSSVNPFRYSMPCCSYTPGGVGIGRPTNLAVPRAGGTSASIRCRSLLTPINARTMSHQSSAADHPSSTTPIRPTQCCQPPKPSPSISTMPCNSSQSGASSATTIAGSQSGEYRRVGSISGRAAFQVAASPATPATSNENAPTHDTQPRMPRTAVGPVKWGGCARPAISGRCRGRDDASRRQPAPTEPNLIAAVGRVGP